MEDHKAGEAGKSGYEDLFIRFSARVEKVLIILVSALLCALMLSQLLLQHPQIRYVMVKVEQLEGKLYSESKALGSDGK
ncbi:hypothetical protein [Paenibacillus silviterrae]|uniref:hypothetical protein n=1 Tax=Paenibacillus silviterrae TaxID=3242194 RepID=UPI002543CBA1|nr:hypothetical protein [Paenibacillus chinjuensis]